MGCGRQAALGFSWPILAGLLAACASSSSGKGASEPDARAVLERFASVTHLAERLPATRSRRERGTVSFAGLEGKLDSWSARPSLQKVTLDLAGLGAMVSGCDGRVAWVSGQLTGSRLLEGMDGYQACLESAYEAALKPAEVYESMRNDGRTTFEGVECWRLELVARLPPGMDAEATRAARTTHEYYEVASGLLLGVEATIDGEFGTGPSTTVYSDYRDFAGATLAARKVSRVSGIEMVFVTESVEFDTSTPEDLAPPVEVARMIEARGGGG